MAPDTDGSGEVGGDSGGGSGGSGGGSSGDLDDVVGRLVAAMDTAMVVVTAQVDGERSGCLVGFHTPCGIDPPRYAVWISKANHTYGTVLRASHVAVHLLGTDDLALAERFGTTTGDDIDKFEGLEVTDGPGGVPLITTCPNRLVLERTALLDEGSDHLLVAGEVVEVRSDGSADPLRFTDVDHLEPGHEAEGRRAPETEPADEAR